MKNLPLFLLFIGLFFNSNVLAQTEFDASFASTGKRAVVFGIGGAYDGTVQPDNKFLMTGPCAHIDWGQHQICVARLNEDGSFDTAFNGTGYVYKTVPGTRGGDGASYEIALQSDGKIVTLAEVYNAPSERVLALARFNANGSIDTSFGTNGFVTATTGTAIRPGEMAVQPDGKIVFSVSIGTSSAVMEQYVYRYNADGTPDTTFGSGGVVHYAVPEYSTTAWDMVIQPDGKILTSGALYSRASPPATPFAYLMTRLNPDGTFDATFDGDGILTNPANSGFYSIALQGDGRILALGGSIIHRFNSNGSIDTTFGTNGSRPAFPVTTSVSELTVTPSGKITAIGSSIYDSPINVDTVNRVMRYLPDGSPDTSFSGDGFFEYEVSNGNDVPVSVFYDSKGRTGIVGYVYGTNVYGQYIAARLAAAPSQNVGFSGRVTKPDGRAVVNAYLTLKNGSEVIGYARTNPFGYFRFANVPSNITYTLSTVSKNLSFYDRSVLVDGAVENYWIVGK